MTVYLFHVVEEKNAKVLVLLQVRRKPSKSKAFEFIRYISSSRSKIEDKCKDDPADPDSQESIIAHNRFQENLVKSVSCRLCHADVTLLENVSASSGLHSSWIVSCEIKHCPSRNLSENFLTLLRERRNSNLAKDIFRQEQHLNRLCN